MLSQSKFLGVFEVEVGPEPVQDLGTGTQTCRHSSHVLAAQENKQLTHEAIQLLQGFPWPGNVRELRHTIERACGMAGEERTTLNQKDFESLGSELHLKEILPQDPLQWEGSVMSFEAMERMLLLKALKVTGGHRKHAAQILGVARSTLFLLIKKHKIRVSPTQHDSLQPKRVDLSSSP